MIFWHPRSLPACTHMSSWNEATRPMWHVCSPECRNRQVSAFFEIVEYLQPGYVVMENVMDSLNKQDGVYVKHATGTLLTLRYQTRTGTCMAGLYGVAQGRWRCSPHPLPPRLDGGVPWRAVGRRLLPVHVHISPRPRQAQHSRRMTSPGAYFTACAGPLVHPGLMRCPRQVGGSQPAVGRPAASSVGGAVWAQGAAGRGQGGRRAAAAVPGAGPPVAAACVRRRQQPHPQELPELRGQLPERRQPERGAPPGTSTPLSPSLPPGDPAALPGTFFRPP